MTAAILQLIDVRTGHNDLMRSVQIKAYPPVSRLKHEYSEQAQLYSLSVKKEQKELALTQQAA